IPREDRAMREGRWQTSIGPVLDGKVLGVIGLGRLGLRVGEIGKAFGMELIAWSQNLTQDRAEEAGARLVTKEELFSMADVISIHYVLSDRSRGLVGAQEIRLMKPTAYL